MHLLIARLASTVTHNFLRERVHNSSRFYVEIRCFSSFLGRRDQHDRGQAYEQNFNSRKAGQRTKAVAVGSSHIEKAEPLARGVPYLP